MSLKKTLLLLAFSLAAGMVTAQGAEVGFGDSDHDSSAPVEVTADSLEVQRDLGKAKFTGNAVVAQGEMRLIGDVIDVEYGENLQGETEVQKIVATGSVTLVNGSEAAEGETAVYSVETGEVVMTGDVLVTQGTNTIAGERLRVNLDTGVGVVEGRVRVFFNPESTSETAE